jgi:phosphoglycolate phosphatase
MTAKFSGIRAVIVDLDGTMVDTAGDFRIAINRMRAEFGLPPLLVTTITDFVGKGSEHLVRGVLSLDWEAQQVAERFDVAMASYQRHYLDINGDHSAVYPGVREGLQALKQKGLRLACVTNKPIAFTQPLLMKKGLHTFFGIVYGGDSLPRKKPDPAPLLQVCTDFGLKPDQVVAIGDSINDAQAARAAGCFVLHVPYGYNHGHAIQEVDTDGIVNTLLDAAPLITN